MNKDWILPLKNTLVLESIGSVWGGGERNTTLDKLKADY